MMHTLAGTVDVKQAVIVEIVQKLGLSPVTVSRALNDHLGFRSERKTRVRKAARSVSCLPNRIANRLKSTCPSTTGMVVPAIRLLCETNEKRNDRAKISDDVYQADHS